MAFDIPTTVLSSIADTVPMHFEAGRVTPDAQLDATLHLDEMDIMDIVWDVEERIDTVVPFSEEEKLYSTGTTVQNVIDLFTRLYNEQHPTPQ